MKEDGSVTVLWSDHGPTLGTNATMQRNAKARTRKRKKEVKQAAASWPPCRRHEVASPQSPVSTVCFLTRLPTPSVRLRSAVPLDAAAHDRSPGRADGRPPKTTSELLHPEGQVDGELLLFLGSAVLVVGATAGLFLFCACRCHPFPLHRSVAAPTPLCASPPFLTRVARPMVRPTHTAGGGGVRADDHSVLPGGPPRTPGGHHTPSARRRQARVTDPWQIVGLVADRRLSPAFVCFARHSCS